MWGGLSSVDTCVSFNIYFNYSTVDVNGSIDYFIPLYALTGIFLNLGGPKYTYKIFLTRNFISEENGLISVVNSLICLRLSDNIHKTDSYYEKALKESFVLIVLLHFIIFHLRLYRHLYYTNLVQVTAVECLIFL